MSFPGWILLLVLNRCLCYDLTYFVEEDQRPGAYVGDIASDTRLLDSVSAGERRYIKFSQLLQGVVGSPLLFRVARNTGKIYTAQRLDAEQLCRHTKECAQFVKVAVRREESFIKILKVRVIVRDINDHVPRFPVQQIDVKFSESDAKGTRVPLPNAVDGDIGIANSQVTYELASSDNRTFAISVSKKTDGTVGLSLELKGTLDREIKDTYVVHLIAKDSGSPSKQSSLQVNVSVTDVNDNVPVFSQSLYNVSVIYEEGKDILVVVLSARDLDLGNNAKVSYRFASKTSDLVKSYFELKKHTGELYFRSKIRTGQNMTFKLSVKVVDGGYPQLSSIAEVLVSVINQPNDPPEIDIKFFSGSKGNSTVVSENTGVGGLVAYVMVSDRDAGKKGEVSCDMNDNDTFQLQRLTGNKYRVTVGKPIDRETKDGYEIAIFCRDNGTPPMQSESRFFIQVTDVNDMKPTFSKESFTFYINENAKSGTRVGIVNATDPDLGPGGKLTYSLQANGDRFLPFRITEDGNLNSVTSLDAEFQALYKFWVVATDNGTPPLNNSAHISVEVKDLNDNVPYFTFPSINPFTLDIVYHRNHTRNITTLKASDNDSMENALLNFELTKGNDKQIFHINNKTGLLFLGRELTQADTGLYHLQFVVKDNGDPVLSSTTSLNIRLIVSNRTFENLNALRMDPNDKIHMYLLIFIVLAAIFASIIITAPISVCLIRCNDHKRPKRKRVLMPSNTHIRDVKMAKGSTYWAEEPDNTTEDEDAVGNMLTMSKRAICDTNGTYNKDLRNRCLGMKDHTNKDIIHEEVEESCEKDLEELTFMLPNSSNKMISGHIDSGDCWSDADMRQDEETGSSDHLYRSSMKSRAASPALTENNHTMSSQNKAANNRTFSSSLGDADSITRRFYKSRMNGHTGCRDCDSLRTSKTESSISGSQVGTWSPASSHNRLHTVPEMLTNLQDCTRQIALDSGQRISSDISIQAPVAKFVVKVVDAHYLPQETCT